MWVRRAFELSFLVVLLSLNLSTVAQAGDGLVFTKAFEPEIIGPGSTTVLRFEIVNTEPVPVADIAFTDILPPEITLALPALPFTDCVGGILDAPDGGTTISLSEAQVGVGDSCSITVFVTSAVPGTHSNTSGDLSSDTGTTPGATADLVVDVTRPGLSKSFSPTSIPPGGTSTLTLVIDNTAMGAVDNFGLFLDDPLPAGMVIAALPNATTDCGNPLLPPLLTALPGSGLIRISANGFAPSFPALVAGASCSIVVDVTAEASGLFDNVTFELRDFTFPDQLSSGFAVARLEVPQQYLNKVFTDDPVPPGSTVTLEFTVTNLDRTTTANGITFSDDLETTLTGLVATGLPIADPCGAGSSLSGTDTITLGGGTLAPEASCTFGVTLQVPPGAIPGAYPNTTGTITSDIWTGNMATDVLVVAPVPAFTKSYLVDPVIPGGTTTLEFTITNTSPISMATDIAFFDQLVPFLPFPVSATLPTAGFCGAGATMSLAIRPGTEDQQGLSMSGGSLEPAGMPGDSCTFTVDIDIPLDQPADTYVNTTDPITAMLDGAMLSGPAASDSLTVVAAPDLTKAFIDDPVAPGDMVTLELNLDYSATAAAAATEIGFTDDLAATLAGLTAVGLPLADVCGPGNGTLVGSAGDTLLTFSGATLAPGEVCTFQVTLQVPGAAAPGTYTNTTSQIAAMVDGLATVGLPAEDDLLVTGFLVNKEFTDDPVLPGGTINLRFTLDNLSGSVDANNVGFTDDLDAVLDGLVVLPPVPVDPCAGTLILALGDTLLDFDAGSVLAGESCSFDVSVHVPVDAPDGDAINTTSVVLAELPGAPFTVLPPAVDLLSIASDPLLLDKTFTDDPVTPGETVSLEFTLANTFHQAATAVGFSDDLGATLSGLVATGLPQSVCGGTLDGTDVVTLAGASLAAEESCTFSVTLQVPAGAAAGSYLNTTSPPSGMIDALAVGGDPASDTLFVRAMSFSKAFDSPTVAGGSPALTFTLANEDPNFEVSSLVFADELEAVLPGLVATGLPLDDVCGPGSQLSGTSTLVLTGASLGPSTSCVIPVTLEVPDDAMPGTYLNVTTSLASAGLSVADPAIAELQVEPPPGFAKAFDPDIIQLGAVSTLVFTLDNTESVLAAGALDFTDTLPAGMTVADPANASTDCDGGILDASPGSGVVSYTGGTVAASSSCTVQVDVTSDSEGEAVNVSGELTSSSGNSGTATATLTVGFLFIDGFESGDTSAWSSTVP